MTCGHTRGDTEHLRHGWRATPAVYHFLCTKKMSSALQIWSCWAFEPVILSAMNVASPSLFSFQACEHAEPELL